MTTPTAFVTRETEFAALDDFLAQALEGKGQLCFIVIPVPSSRI